MVRAPELTTEAIMGAISKGEFYTTTGIELVDVQVSKKSYTVEIKKLGETAYTTTFIGKDGKVLEESNDIKSTYTITGKEGYVRARISASTGDTAFTQPIMLK